MWSKLTFLPVVAAGMLLCSCSDDSKPDFYNGTGLLSISLEVVEPEGVDITLPSQSEFSLDITPLNSPDMAHHWNSFTAFQQNGRYRAEEYQFTVLSGNEDEEGFDMPCFGATQTEQLVEGSTNHFTLSATLLNVPVKLEATERFNQAFPGWTAMIHAEGGTFLNFDRSETRTAFVRPQPMSVSVTPVTDKATLRLANNVDITASVLTELLLDADGADMVLTSGGKELKRITITRELLDAPAPTVTCGGSVTASIDLLELTQPTDAMVFTINSASTPQDAILTINSASMRAAGAPLQIDLAHPTATQRAFLEENGVAIPAIGSETTRFDITPLLDNLQFMDNGSNTSEFSLTVTDEAGRQSAPSVLTVNTLPVSFKLVSASDIIIGINILELVVATPTGTLADKLRTDILEADGSQCQAELLGAEPLDNGTYRVTLKMPDGTGPITLMVYYGEQLKARLELQRVPPEFTVKADPFASKVTLRIASESHPELLPVIVRRMLIYANGSPAVIQSRDEEKGLLTVIGLSPSKAYTLAATLMPEDLFNYQEVKIVTESAEELPNGDFEDVKKTVKWHDMQSGGLYSQTFAEIFNCLNKASFEYYTPTRWANTNDKTFNTSSKRANTWYMQPSVYSIEKAASADYAVELVSAAFDPDGEEIPDYLQESLPYVKYSRNIPNVRWRAAGKIWLGSYTFKPFPVPTETMTEGVPFKSRPSSLNGFYTYHPTPADPSDMGLVTVEVLGYASGSEQVIASGEALLAPATGYTAFTIPLNYYMFGVKATRIKVMCASSSKIGGIDHESANVPVYFDASTGSALGSRLQLDNLTFAY